MKVLVSSGFTETELNSFREMQYPRVLTAHGWDVTVNTSDQSYIWKYNRARMEPTNPAARDDELQQRYRYRILRFAPLLRFSDFVLMWLPIREIKNSDVVHIIEFRQGNALAVAIAAKLMGKPVVYDHEQRGDRHYTWLHTLDSLFRRFLIGAGSCFCDLVRHTVHANREHFISCRWSKRAKLAFSPLAADEQIFYFSDTVREDKRKELQLEPKEKAVALTGKLGHAKRSIDAAKAVLKAGLTLVIAGRVSDDLKAELDHLNGRIIMLGHVTPEEINRIYCACDYAIFTTFSISYWEALTTDLSIIVPRTSFSEAAIPSERSVLFGEEQMFRVVEEHYLDDFSVEMAVATAIQTLPSPTKQRQTDSRYSWAECGNLLNEQYKSLIKKV